MSISNLNQNSPVRLLIADDQRLLREGIASLLSLQAGIEVVGTAANGQEALEKTRLLNPEVILMDVRMPIMAGVEATALIKRQFPTCKILMLTTFDDEEYVIEALKAGASGYLLKTIPEDDLAQAVIAAHKGIYQLDPAVALKVVASLGNPSASSRLQSLALQSSSPTNAGLTERELEVLKLTSQGLSNSEIARSLSISEGTVKNHISSILSRLGLRDRIQAIIYARENGLF
ncbi:response regulator transcription factor (plasmid) [Candidatus Chlorohelix allophototropha]|uniref:Response regulator transcription factor n=1 Tax=Candidatus Chlorohelix allophototropha TaxID=3003348 RepID=A0ABY9BA45_9CHLR|nr:response regulator transcription factor [Chloroflexota bacterium L227-S17]